MPWRAQDTPRQRLRSLIQPEQSQSFAVRLTASQLGALVDYNVSFGTLDCTGQAYLSLQSYPTGSLLVLPLLSFAAVLNATAYIGGSTITNGVTAYSHLTLSGMSTLCLSWGGGGLTTPFVPVEATYDLSTLGLTPPYSVH